MKILLDVNLSPDWIDFLAQHGFPAVHWTSIGGCDDPDPKILHHAAIGQFVLLTQDLDFGTILAGSKARRPTVIQIRSGRVNPKTLGFQVVAALQQLTQQPDQQALITIERKRTRLTLLPIRKED